MSREEAVKEAREQFQQQGVNLRNRGCHSVVVVCGGRGESGETLSI